MDKIITVLVFVGYVLALLVCLIAVLGGIWLAFTAYKSRRRTKDEATLEHPESGWKLHVKATGGILLAIAGLVGCCFIIYYYWQTLLGILVLIIGGGGETVLYKSKKKRLKRRSSRRKLQSDRY